MRIRYSSHPHEVQSYDTTRLRAEFLVDDLFEVGKLNMIYSHLDRVVALGIWPVDDALALDNATDPKNFGTAFFLQRRELGIVNIGEGKAQITTADAEFTLAPLEVLYVGAGTQNVRFASADSSQPAILYALSAPAHCTHPTRIVTYDQARKVVLGSQQNANAREINQYLHPEVVTTCQLCMGITHLAEGSVWNTMPAHTHDRRMEAYLYFNLKPSQVVFHYMGEPEETRHIVVRDKEVVLSPSWSIHAGCGTQNYSFVWGMLGENQTFDDMDFVDMDTIR